MKQVVLQIPDKRYHFFLELMKNLKFIKEVNLEVQNQNNQILEDIKQSVEELKMVKAGKLVPKPLKELLDEI
jgi:hypothetical protein